jgi:hypothetical protein
VIGSKVPENPILFIHRSANRLFTKRYSARPLASMDDQIYSLATFKLAEFVAAQA